MNIRMLISRKLVTLTVTTAALLASLPAADAPHDVTFGIDCDSCHTPNQSAEGDITTFTGTANLCLSCHHLGGLATSVALDPAGQAVPGVSGTSHRWDSDTLPEVLIHQTNGSTGRVGVTGSLQASGSVVVSCEIAVGGDLGEAVLQWTDTLGGSGTAELSSSVDIGTGLSLAFANGTSPSFASGMQFSVHTRPLGIPSDPDIAGALKDGAVVCSTCHDAHLNATEPFLRVANTGSALCEACHAERSMGTWAMDPGLNIGQHPTDIPLPADGRFDVATAASLLDDRETPADTSDDTVECLSCHSMHRGDSGVDGDPTLLGEGDGNLLIMEPSTTLCRACHTYQSHGTNDCDDCHTPHGTSNILLVRDVINDTPVELLAQGAGAYTSGAPDYDGICETCHTATAYHRGDPSGDHVHNAGIQCTSCHVHRNGFSINSVDCMSCHSVSLNSTPDGLPVRAIDSDFSRPQGHHPLTYDISGDLSTPASNNCLICHLEQSANDPLHANEVVDLDPDPDGSGATEWQTTPGNLHSWCVDCHDGDNPDPSRRLGGLIAPDKSFMATDSTHRTDWPNGGAVFGGLCDSCHQNGHTSRTQFFSAFFNEGHEEDLCYGCHGGASNVRANEDNRYLENMKVAYHGTGAVNPRSQHIVDGRPPTDDGEVVCRNCHDPHRLDHQSNLLCNPADPQTSWGGDVDNAWCNTCHDGARAADPQHIGIDVTGLDCRQCHLAHASTNLSLVVIAELASESIDVTPDPATVPVFSFQQFQPNLIPSLPYLTDAEMQRQADWSLVGITGGTAGTVISFEANIPLDRTVGYDPSGWGLITVTSTGEVTTGPSLIEDLNLHMDVPHHYRGDLEVTLRNQTTGAEAQLLQSNWNDGTHNLIQTLNSESPTPPWSGPAASPTNTGTGIVNAFIDRDGYTGPPEGVVYTITIATTGDSGVATFDWSDSGGGSGTGLTTSTTPTDLGNGVRVVFYNAWGGVSPQFPAGNSWTYNPLDHWDTQPDSLTAFNNRNSNGLWEVELRDTWPSDNPTDPASATFCWWRSWSLILNSGVLGSITETGALEGLYEGTGRVYATIHHGRIWPVQSGLSDFVFEQPLPISDFADLTVGPALAASTVSDLTGESPMGRVASPPPAGLALERTQQWSQAVSETLAEQDLAPHSPEVLGLLQCADCHGRGR